jgi:hypothetical protein
VEGPEQSTTKLITLPHSVHWALSAIGQNYGHADEDLLLEMYKAREWEMLIGASTRREIELLCLGLARVRPGS